MACKQDNPLLALVGKAEPATLNAFYIPHHRFAATKQHPQAVTMDYIHMPTDNPRSTLQVLDHLQSHPMTVTSLPMQYDADPTVQLPECIAGLQPADVLPNGSSSSSSTARKHMAQVIAGLLYVACGGLDAAHNLVTPLCWGSWTPYAGVEQHAIAFNS
jgi:hypothetical protein